MMPAKTRSLALVPALAALILLIPGARAQITVDHPIPPVATIRVDAGQSAGTKIPRTIFGSFLEPIGNSTYNGLWAGLLKNPSLEAGMWDAPHVAEMLKQNPALAHASQLGLPLPWEPLDPGQGNRYEPVYGNAANSFRSLIVMGVPGQPTGIRQEVYLPVQRTLSYVGSLYAGHISGPTDLTVSIRVRNNPEVLASAHIDATADTWTKYKFTLDVPQGKLHRLDPSDFVIEVEGDERVDLDEFSLMPSDNLDGLDPDVVAMAKAMDTPLVRFGGNFTSGYNWRDGVGPRDKRVSMMNLAWGIPEYNTFGTDEFLHFCDLIGAEPQFALNLGGGTPQEAAEWVRYIDQHWHQHSGLLWELGNELWGNWNLGYPTLDQLAARTLAFSKAIHAVEPTSRLIATGADPDGFTKWNATQLSNPAGTFNYLSTHFVVTVSDTQKRQASNDFITSAAFALPVELGRKLHDEQAQINQYPAFADKAHVAFTEWLYIGRHGTPSFTNMGGAVDAAGMLNMLMRNHSVVPISDMTGIMDFAGIWKKRGQVFASPAYWAFRMYSSAHATRPVDVKTESGSYSVQHGVTRLPDIANVPYLDVVAALNDSGTTLTLFCVNRSLNTDIPADISVDGFTSAGAAQIKTLKSVSVSDGNDEDVPNRVTPVHTEESIDAGKLHHIFPHESVTVITLHKNS
ncbi:MAG: alpha-L-arabinofuranosidase C-terminal domain-containing protein [Acidobacteriaceae bacterium]